jgi:DNA-3-methyladenine glycosylase
MPSQFFYQQKTEEVAKQLLGKKLVRIYKGKRLSGIITETEAYLGLTDKACHSYGGKRTKKVTSMWLRGGHGYIYHIHGRLCFNVVTLTSEHPEAVLIRALEPLEGIEEMKRFRDKEELKQLTTGPAKLTEALNIIKDFDGKPLNQEPLFIEDHIKIPKSQIVAKPRIGIHYAEEAIEWPLRYYIKDSQFISKR